MSTPSLHKNDAIQLTVFVQDEASGEAIDLTDTEIYALINGDTNSPLDATIPNQVTRKGYADIDVDGDNLTAMSEKTKFEIVWVYDTIADKERTIFYDPNFYIKPSDK